jgi:hypothetical protein
MIGTSLLMIGLGLARALIFVASVPPIVVVILMYMVQAITALIFLYFDYKKSPTLGPFLTFPCCLSFTSI